MKKKVFLICSVISLLLVAFPVSVCADETTPNSSSGSEGAVIPFLDSYFYDNYDILPYIEASGTQYINTGINPSDSIICDLTFSDLYVPEGASIYPSLFGSRISSASGSSKYLTLFSFQNNRLFFDFGLNSTSFLLEVTPYTLYSVSFGSDLYFNGSLVHSFSSGSFDISYPIYIFGVNQSNVLSTPSAYKLYKFSIYDSALDANDEPIGYVRYYYPAKAKTSGTIGLYDAVSKTFFPSLGSQPFANPTDDKVLNFQISDFLTSGLSWIGDILDFVVETPILIFFMAIGLAGVAFRWSKRILHF